MNIIIKRMETDEEIKGKAFVHWKAWHEAYPDLVSQEYLDNLTYEKCESMAFSWRDNLIVAMDGNTVIGFVGYGDRGEESPNAGAKQCIRLRCLRHLSEQCVFTPGRAGAQKHSLGRALKPRKKKL